MTARLVHVREIEAYDIPRWQHLADHAVEPNAWLDPRFILPALDYRDFVDDLMLLIVEDSDEWRALLPLSRSRVSTELPLAGTSTNGRLMDWYGMRQHPLLDQDRTLEAMNVLLYALAHENPQGFVELRGIPVDGPLAEAFDLAIADAHFGLLVRAEHEVAWARRRVGDGAVSRAPGDDWPAVIDPVWRSPARRNALRREGRKLAEAAGGGELIMRDVSDDPNALTRLIEMQAAGWKGDVSKGGAAIGLDPEREAFVRELSARFATSGDFLIYEFGTPSTVVSIVCLVVSNATAFAFYDAYDERFAAHSPGKLARIATVAHLTSQPRFARFDPSVVESYDQVLAIFPDRRTFRDVLIGAGWWRSRAVRFLPTVEASQSVKAALTAARRVKQSLHSVSNNSLSLGGEG
jgi:hypothetical protein